MHSKQKESHQWCAHSHMWNQPTNCCRQMTWMFRVSITRSEWETTNTGFEDVKTCFLCIYRDWYFVQAPDYFDIIKTPMDFSVIRNKINRFEYLQPSDLLLDVDLIFVNYKEYNMPTAPVFAAGQILESHFRKRLRELKLTSLLPTLSGVKSSKSSRALRKRTL